MTQPTAHPTPELEFPFERELLHPSAEYRDMQAAGGCPVVHLASGRDTYLATRYDDVRAVCMDPAFSSDTTNPGFPEMFPSRTSDEARETTFIFMDPPQHDAHRRMLAAWFRVKEVVTMRPGMQEVVDEYIDEMIAKGAPADLYEDFALRLPTWVVCRLLGVPREDEEFFQHRTQVRLDMSQSEEAMLTAQRELNDYVSGLIDEKAERPTEDLMSHLVHAEYRRGTLSRDELVNLVRLLLVAGHETTASTIGLSIIVLLENPDQLAALREDDSLWPTAIEELLRFTTPTHFNLGRVATADTEIGGTPIPSGAGMRALIDAANRDPAKYVDPDRFDIRRDARDHLAFGSGLHQCLGQNYARAELEIALRTLFRRLPNLRLATALAELPRRRNSIVNGVASLPVEW